MEVLWAIDGYLKNALKKEAFLDAVRKAGSAGRPVWKRTHHRICNARKSCALYRLCQPDRKRVWHPGRIRHDHRCPLCLGHRACPVHRTASGIFPSVPNHMPHLAHGGYQVGFTFEAWETFLSTGNLLPARKGCSLDDPPWLFLVSTGCSAKLKIGWRPILKFLDELDEEGYPFDLVAPAIPWLTMAVGYGHAGLRPPNGMNNTLSPNCGSPPPP